MCAPPQKSLPPSDLHSTSTNSNGPLRPPMTPPPTHYEILNLPSTFHHEAFIPKQTLRAAYRRALIHHHPDKTPHAAKVSGGKSATYTVDQITQAFAVLSDSTRKREYEKNLNLHRTIGRGGIGGDGSFNGLEGNERGEWKTGVEVVDLDDLVCSEGKDGVGIWFRACRCGDERGFVVEERDLEEAAEEGEGEVLVGCRGCSLWAVVLFGVLDGEEAGEEASEDRN